MADATTSQQFWNLKLHEKITIYSVEHHEITALKVPGGWLYQTIEFIEVDNQWRLIASNFIPFPPESQDIKMPAEWCKLHRRSE